MDWQVIIVAIGVFASAVALFKHFYRAVKKPESVCDSCPMKENCTANCGYQKAKTITPDR